MTQEQYKGHRFGKEYMDNVQGGPESWDERIHAQHRLIEAAMRPEGGDRILDVGCANGRLSIYLTRNHPGIVMTSTDISADAGKLVEGEFVRASMTRLPFPDATFDKVFAIQVISHFKDGALGIREAWRVLKPGGKLMILTPNKRYVQLSRLAHLIRGKRFDYDRTARWLYSKAGMRHIMAGSPWAKVRYGWFGDRPRTLPLESLSEKIVVVATK